MAIRQLSTRRETRIKIQEHVLSQFGPDNGYSADSDPVENLRQQLAALDYEKTPCGT